VLRPTTQPQIQNVACKVDSAAMFAVVYLRGLATHTCAHALEAHACSAAVSCSSGDVLHVVACVRGRVEGGVSQCTASLYRLSLHVDGLQLVAQCSAFMYLTTFVSYTLFGMHACVVCALPPCEFQQPQWARLQLASWQLEHLVLSLGRLCMSVVGRFVRHSDQSTSHRLMYPAPTMRACM
jgi:hypothetical protein